MRVPIVNRSHHPLPAYATPGAAGMDLRAFLRDPSTILPWERRLMDTGISLALAQGFEAQIRPRSGLALRKGITVLNTPGTIDADYRGEIKVLLMNLSNEPFVVQDGDRIAQLVIAPYLSVNWELVCELEPTGRGSGGYGSTGIQ